jgi:hypothetical protein
MPNRAAFFRDSRISRRHGKVAGDPRGFARFSRYANLCQDSHVNFGLNLPPDTGVGLIAGNGGPPSHREQGRQRCSAAQACGTDPHAAVTRRRSAVNAEVAARRNGAASDRPSRRARLSSPRYGESVGKATSGSGQYPIFARITHSSAEPEMPSHARVDMARHPEQSNRREGTRRCRSLISAMRACSWTRARPAC